MAMQNMSASHTISEKSRVSRLCDCESLRKCFLGYNQSARPFSSIVSADDVVR